MSIPHLAQYQGSKRLLDPQILAWMPDRFQRLIEPFSGMASISIAAATHNKSDSYYINDINEPLIVLLREAVEVPERLSRAYEQIWNEQFTYGAVHTDHFLSHKEQI